MFIIILLTGLPLLYLGARYALEAVSFSNERVIFTVVAIVGGAMVLIPIIVIPLCIGHMIDQSENVTMYQNIAVLRQEQYDRVSQEIRTELQKYLPHESRVFDALRHTPGGAEVQIDIDAYAPKLPELKGNETVQMLAERLETLLGAVYDTKARVELAKKLVRMYKRLLLWWWW